MEQTEKKAGITGSTLKLIAMFTMLIDHTSAIILEQMLLKKGFADIDMNDLAAYNAFVDANEVIFIASITMRSIGRLAFPIFCFLLVEGFLHTKNVGKYARNLAIFAIISEVPFDLAFTGNLFDMRLQNVFFTLLIGLIVIYMISYFTKKLEYNRSAVGVCTVVIAMIGMLTANLLIVDYSSYGVLTIVIMYLFRRSRLAQGLGGCAVLTFMSWGQIPAFFSLLPIKLYNGERGIRLKYVFYLFYPAHILILYAIFRFIVVV